MNPPDDLTMQVADYLTDHGFSQWTDAVAAAEKLITLIRNHKGGSPDGWVPVKIARLPINPPAN